MMGSAGDVMGWSMWALMALGALGLWAVAALVGWGFLREWRRPTAPAPLTLLDRRLANGEIDGEQYLHLRRLLTLDR